MERRQSPGTRPRIPGGYGNYPGRDPDSPPPQSDSAWGTGQKKRTQGPWGGYFEGQDQAALPTKPWQAGAPLHPDDQQEQQHHQQQYWQAQRSTSQRWDTASGYSNAAAGASQPRPGQGSIDQDPTQPQPQPRDYYYGPARPRRRQSPLVADAPRLTVMPTVSREKTAASGASPPSTVSQDGDKFRRAVSTAEQKQGTPRSSTASFMRESSRRGAGMWSSVSGPNILGGSRKTLSEDEGGDHSWGVGGGGLREGRNLLDGGYSTSGFAAAEHRSPFLAARSPSEVPSTWRSPMGQSSVNPFSASFGGDRGSPTPGGSSWVRGSGRNKGEGQGGSSVQPLLGRGSGGYGGNYGSRWEGTGGGVLSGGGGGTEGKVSASKKPRAFSHTVDDQGNQIFYKHGVRLVEATEIQLEALGQPATYTVFLLPYLLLALALWLDRWNLDVTSHSFPPFDNACNNSGVCVWILKEVPMYNSFLTLQGEFTLVDGVLPEVSPDEATDVDGLFETSNVEASGDGGQHRRMLLLGGVGKGIGGEDQREEGEEEEVDDNRHVVTAIVDAFNDDWSDAGATTTTIGGGHGSDISGKVDDEWRWRLGWGRQKNRRGLFSFGEGDKGEQQKKKHRKDSDQVHLDVGVALEIRGSTGNEGRREEWELLYHCTARSNVQVVTCYKSDGFCEPATLDHVVFNTPGSLKIYSQYTVEATFVLIQDGQPVPRGGALLAEAAAFNLQTEKQVYVEALAITRLPLLALTAGFLLYMIWGFGRAGAERDPAPSSIVPERLYITLLLFGLLLWQNPVLAVEEWIHGGFGDGDRRWARLARDLCQFVGMQLVWLCWICLMDGQHFVGRRRRPDPQYSASGEDTNASLTDSGDGTVPLHGFLKDAYPPHHPSSESFIDFILPKLLYGVTSLVVGVALALVRHPAIARLDHVDWLAGERLEWSYVGLSVAAGVFLVGWAVYFAKITISSGRALRGQPFMATRRQQLSYRVMVMQAFLVAVLLGLGVGINLVGLVRHLIQQQIVPGAKIDFTLEAFMNEAAGLSAWTGGVREPLGKLLLISAVCYNLAYVFLPPAHSVKRLFDRMYINMERDMPPREVVRRYKDSQELSPLFCVETSCYLVEVAWQVYYDPHRVTLDDSLAPGRQDLSYLGLELVAYFYDEELETRAMLCRGKDRLVLAFRGTARIENLMTDLKFHQVPLPQMLPAGRAPIVINLSDAHCGSRFGNNGGFGDGATGATSASGADREMRGRFGRAYSTPNTTTGTSAAAAAAAAARRSSQPSHPASVLPRDGRAALSSPEDRTPPSKATPARSPALPLVEEAATATATSKDLEANVAHDRGAGAEGVGEGSGDGDRVSPPAATAGTSSADGEASWLLVSPPPPSDTGDPAEDFPSAAAEEGVDGEGNKKASPPPTVAGAAARDDLVGDDGDDGDDGNESKRGKIDGNGHRNLQVQADSSSSSHYPGGEAHEFPGRMQHASGSPTRVGGGNDDRGWSAQGPYEMGKDGMNVYENPEAVGGLFDEGDFDIDPRGKMSFTRCCRACIDRIPVAKHALPRVHGGFWEAYSKMREKVLAAVASELQADYRPLYVTGHSLGGALANLAAYDIDKNFSLPDPLTLYTFGSPRVGNGVFCRKLDNKVKHNFRVVNDGDLVTGLPRFFGTYKHAGCMVVVDSDRYGHFIVAPTMVEQTFGAKPLASITPHLLNQYRECLEACMEEADLEDYFSRVIGSYLEDYWPCAGGLSVVDTIGMQMRGLINSGLTEWRMTVLMETVAESGKEEWMRWIPIEYPSG